MEKDNIIKKIVMLITLALNPKPLGQTTKLQDILNVKFYQGDAISKTQSVGNTPKQMIQFLQHKNCRIKQTNKCITYIRKSRVKEEEREESLERRKLLRD